MDPQTSTQEEEDFKIEILPDDYTQYDLSFKIIVIGDSGVGKSCLTNKATKNVFEDSYKFVVVENFDIWFFFTINFWVLC